jgi:hypothetical protein
MKSVREMFEKANQNSNKASKFITPETVQSGDTITIVGPATDLALKGATYDDQFGGSLNLRFENEAGGWISKKIYEIDPAKQLEFAQKNKQVLDGKKTAQQLADENSERTLNNLIYLHNRAFGRSYTVDLNALNENTVKGLFKALFEKAPYENTKYNISLKLELREESGQYPKYQVLKYGTWWNSDPTKLAISKWDEDNLKLVFTRVEAEESEDVEKVETEEVIDDSDDLL